MRAASRWCTALTITLLLAGCFSSRGPGPEGRLADHTRLDVDQIEASGAQTAWEALRLINGLRLEEDAEGRPVGLVHRGHRSLTGPDTPLIVVDGAIHRHFWQLDRIPARDLASIRVRSPASASAEFGSLAQSGVVELTTRRR